jgi:hypothetical protein
MSFAGFQVGGAQQAVDFSIDTPVSGSLEDYPLIGKLLEVKEYKELYYKYLNEATKLYFDSGDFSSSINKLDKLINSYVKNDATAFYTYEQYEKSLPVLKEFGKLRSASVTAQLAGNTTSGTVSIDISALGSMGGGKGGFGGGMNDAQNNQGNAPNIGGGQNGKGNDIPVNGQVEDRQIPDGKVPGNNQGAFPNRQDGFNRNGMGNNGGKITSMNSQNLKTYGIITGVSALFMGAGIIFVLKFKRRKYAARHF